ncbi:cyclin-D4-1-like [Dioscorea cayenensis subsp. rotundata]|uniref:Cyclin-D4-1-like n=1 Tax=Dioscorea cayennensis subsp. rotundata TaxID=55577 RepID=A0AB40BJL4_DIOCR|nr:cyclin-D4-1-like [Dioscorea cayenensis subsp. rotundata]
MGFSYDSAASILLCAEDNNSVLGFEDEEVDVEVGVEGEVERSELLEERCDFYGDFFKVLPIQSDECLEVLVEKELDHLPRGDYAERLLNGDLDLEIRRNAIDWISKVHAHYSFGPLSAYLSVNYLDRFLSAYELPQGKAWMTQLLSVACLSLAAKMEETEVPLSLDLQAGESKYVFEARTIQRMELLVLSTLKWRMQAVTPFSYIDYFLHKFNGGSPPRKSSVSQSIELILSMIRGIEFLAFRPSEIAAAVAFSVLGETQILEIDKALAGCIHVQKERVIRCYAVIQDNAVMINSFFDNASPLVSSVPQSPIGVLDAACLSYKSDELTTTRHESNNSKRRKLCSIS